MSEYENTSSTGEQSLAEAIRDHVLCGASDRSASLGFINMPEGYALMLNPDETHYYWLRFDGAESPICWDRFAVYRGAKANKAITNAKQREE